MQSSPLLEVSVERTDKHRTELFPVGAFLGSRFKHIARCFSRDVWFVIANSTSLLGLAFRNSKREIYKAEIV